MNTARVETLVELPESIERYNCEKWAKIYDRQARAWRRDLKRVEAKIAAGHKGWDGEDVRIAAAIADIVAKRDEMKRRARVALAALAAM